MYLSLRDMVCNSAHYFDLMGINARYRGPDQIFWGLSGFNFTKLTEKQFNLDSTSYVNISTVNFQYSSNINFLHLSLFSIAYRTCTVISQYYDINLQTCGPTCTSPSYPYAETINQICLGCHYSCLTCTNDQQSGCSTCDATIQNRHSVTNGSGTFCTCNSGYL